MDMETSTSSVECVESPDGKHCWHGNLGAAVVYLPGGSNEFSEVCCWCGETRSFVMNLPLSYSVNVQEHGPHHQTKMYYAPEEKNADLLR